MPEVISVEKHWQLLPAINQWLTAKSGKKCTLVFYDQPALSYFISRWRGALEGHVQVSLSETSQAQLLTKTDTWLRTEKEKPGTRDDLLFEILHHPVWKLDPREIDRLALQFYQTRNSKSFYAFLRSQNQLESSDSMSIREAVMQLSAWMEEENIRAAMAYFFAGEEQGNQKEIWKALARGVEQLTLHTKGDQAPQICFRDCFAQQHVLHIFPDDGYSGEDRIVRDQAIFKPHIPLLSEEWIRHSLKNYRLSVSHLNSFLRCPLAFYFETVLRTPSRKSAAMAFGSAVHGALENIFRIMLRGKAGVLPGEAVLIQSFEEAMQGQRFFFPDEKQFLDKVHFGKESLSHYYKRKEAEWKRVVSIERRIQARIDEVPVHGFLDKIEFDYYDADIIDYKTGQISGNMQRFSAPGKAGEEFPFENKQGGNYWRQAVFYHLLIAHDKTTRWKPRKVIFDYIEKQKNGLSEICITPVREEKEIVRGQIRNVYTNIQNRTFDTGCGRAGCYWCRLTVESDYPLLVEQGEVL